MIVETKYGLIQGHPRGEIAEFLGIPYAKPPVGDLRWKEPQTPEPWEGVYEAAEFGFPALQAPSQIIPGGDPADRGCIDSGNEDCLYLNVWTPDARQGRKLPVFVWIHGGAYCCGSGAGMNASPEPYCSRGIVYVTFNYRLGLMGFFAHPELSQESEHHVSGNYQHFDQVAALRWVKENIEAFGGDPDNITIGGCSAGAGGTQVLCCSPLAEGLFARAIIESNVTFQATTLQQMNPIYKLADLEQSGIEFMKKAGCNSVEEMRHTPYEKLIDFEESHFRRKYHYGCSLGTCEDGYLLPHIHRVAMQQLENKNIPYLVGNTHDEGGEHVYGMTSEKFVRQAQELLGEDVQKYLNLSRYDTLEQIQQSLRKTHFGFIGAKIFAECSAKQGRAPVYVFDFVRPNPQRGIAPHAWETKYLMGTYKRCEGVTEEDDRLADTMQNYWCNFIRTGDPNGEGLQQWAPYSGDNRCVLYLDSPYYVGTDEQYENEQMRCARQIITNHVNGKE